VALVGLIETDGSAFTETVSVVVHPLLFVYVITEVPLETPVTTPVEDTEATEVLADTQGFVVAAVPEPVKVVVVPTQADAVPEIVGSAWIVTV
jgi:hypothetical protein